MPKVDPNRVSNLAIVDRPTHRQINKLWREFNDNNKNPSAACVMKQVFEVDKLFGSAMRYWQ
jgi:hypothetical protein